MGEALILTIQSEAFSAAELEEHFPPLSKPNQASDGASSDEEDDSLSE